MNHVSKASFARLSPDDPFQRLPTEIMIQVWSNINVVDLLFSCVMVSRTWRDQLLHCGYLWKKVSLHREDHLSPIALSAVSDHVQRLRLFYLSRRWLTGFHHQIMQGSFASISHLTIMIGGPEHIEKQMLVQMFEKLGCTLKSLYCLTLQNFPDLAVVTKACPFLHSLVYKNVHGLFNLDALEPYPGELRSLTIENHCTIDIERGQLISIVSNLGRHLQALSVYPCGEECISDVQRYCPDIYTIVWNTGYPTLGGIHECEMTLPPPPSSKGLRHLFIRPHHIELIVALMARYKDTLETLDLALVLLRSCNHLERLKYVVMERLSSVSIEGARDRDAGTRIATAILDTCQESLRGLSLEKLYMTPLIRHLSSVRNLESLRLDSVVYSEDMAIYWDYLHKHGNNKRAALISLEFRNVDITGHDLVPLARIDTLKDFTLSFTDDHGLVCYTDHGIQQFFDETRSALRNVVLDLTPISWTTLDILGRIPSIRRVTVSKHIPIDMVGTFRNRYPSLRVEVVQEKEREIYGF